jgi:hypothetical protein
MWAGQERDARNRDRNRDPKGSRLRSEEGAKKERKKRKTVVCQNQVTGDPVGLHQLPDYFIFHMI